MKYFKYFCIKFALPFRFFDSWFMIKYLLTETSGKQYVLWTLDCRCFPRLRLEKHRLIDSLEHIAVSTIMTKVNLFKDALYYVSMCKDCLKLKTYVNRHSS